MIRGVVFDCFGVLITDALDLLRTEIVQSHPEISREVNDVIAASNRGFLEPRDAIDKLGRMTGRSVREVQAALDQAEVRDERLLSFIRQLRPARKTAMLSNISEAGLARRFSPAELSDHFDAVVASGQIGFAKPEPESYEITADRLGLRLDECIMIDDREVCIAGAQAVGMAGILYRGVDDLAHELRSRGIITE